MKRWFSRDSVKAKVGMAAIAMLAGAGVLASMQQPAQLSTRVQSSASLQQNAAPDTIAMSEKPRLDVTRTEIVTEEQEVPFTTMQTYDGTLAKDTSVVRVEGKVGKKVVTSEVKTKDGVEISRELISEEVTVPPVTKVVAIGTKTVLKPTAETPGACDPRYTPCIKKTNRDLDCSDIGFRVAVVDIGNDPHGFDLDNNGIGCEAYPLPQSP